MKTQAREQFVGKPHPIRCPLLDLETSMGSLFRKYLLLSTTSCRSLQHLESATAFPAITTAAVGRIRTRNSISKWSLGLGNPQSYLALSVAKRESVNSWIVDLLMGY